MSEEHQCSPPWFISAAAAMIAVYRCPDCGVRWQRGDDEWQVFR